MCGEMVGGWDSYLVKGVGRAAVQFLFHSIKSLQEGRLRSSLELLRSVA